MPDAAVQEVVSRPQEIFRGLAGPDALSAEIDSLGYGLPVSPELFDRCLAALKVGGLTMDAAARLVRMQVLPEGEAQVAFRRILSEQLEGDQARASAFVAAVSALPNHGEYGELLQDVALVMAGSKPVTKLSFRSAQAAPTTNLSTNPIGDLQHIVVTNKLGTVDYVLNPRSGDPQNPQGFIGYAYIKDNQTPPEVVKIGDTELKTEERGTEAGVGKADLKKALAVELMGLVKSMLETIPQSSGSEPSSGNGAKPSKSKTVHTDEKRLTKFLKDNNWSPNIEVCDYEKTGPAHELTHSLRVRVHSTEGDVPRYESVACEASRLADARGLACADIINQLQTAGVWKEPTA